MFGKGDSGLQVWHSYTQACSFSLDSVIAVLHMRTHKRWTIGMETRSSKAEVESCSLNSAGCMAAAAVEIRIETTEVAVACEAEDWPQRGCLAYYYFASKYSLRYKIKAGYYTGNLQRWSYCPMGTGERLTQTCIIVGQERDIDCATVCFKQREYSCEYIIVLSTSKRTRSNTT